MEKIAVERSVWINTTPERAWQAVTKPEQLNQWYATYYHWSIPALEIGTTVKFYNKDDDTDMQVAKIEVVNPPREFTLRWQPDQTYPAMSLITSFLIQAENDGTRVTISESGYEWLPDDVRQKWFDATSGGYTLSMENLKGYLEGHAIPH